MKSLIIGVLLFPLLSFVPKESVSTEAVAAPSTVQQECKCPNNSGLGLLWLKIEPSEDNPNTTCRLIMFKNSVPGLPVRILAEIPAQCD